MTGKIPRQKSRRQKPPPTDGDNGSVNTGNVSGSGEGAGAVTLGLLGLLGLGGAVFMMKNGQPEEESIPVDDGEHTCPYTSVLPDGKSVLSDDNKRDTKQTNDQKRNQSPESNDKTEDEVPSSTTQNNSQLPTEASIMKRNNNAAAITHLPAVPSLLKPVLPTKNVPTVSRQPLLLLAMADPKRIQAKNAIKVMRRNGNPVETPPMIVQYQPKPRKGGDWMRYQGLHREEDEATQAPETVPMTPSQPMPIYDGNLYDVKSQDSQYEQFIVGVDYDIDSNMKLNFSLGYLATKNTYHLTQNRDDVIKPPTKQQVIGIGFTWQF